jgi:hypothetical protein
MKWKENRSGKTGNANKGKLRGSGPVVYHAGRAEFNQCGFRTVLQPENG